MDKITPLSQFPSDSESSISTNDDYRRKVHTSITKLDLQNYEKISFPFAYAEPMVSIIMPLYEAEPYIGETIDSVVRQTYKNWELIIVDDVSKDDGLDVVAEFAEVDGRIRVYKNLKNQGAAVARNLATQLAKGRFIAFIDSDDLWEHNKLEVQVGFMEERCVPFSYTSFTKFDDSGRIRRIIDSPERLSYSLMLKGNFICTSSVMYDTSLLGKRFFPNILRRQDYGLWLNILREQGSAEGIPLHLTRYRIRQGSLSGRIVSRVKWNWKLHRQIMGVSPFVAGYRLFWNILIKVFVKP